MRKKFTVLFLILFLNVVAAQTQSSKSHPEDIPEQYLKWLEEEVVYIITPTEKDVFLKLQNNVERDNFIKSFWKQRDPTPGTPENEFKKEHYQRIQYANQNFSRSLSTPGWKTDRGRIYIILGPPMNIQRFTSYTKIYPTIVWFYQQNLRGGLPSSFYVVFFDRKGMGEYVIYSPVNDGPQSLLVGYQGHPQDYYSAYKELYDYNAFLAQISISLIPGEAISPAQPTMASNLLVQKINQVPQKEVEDLYAERFIKFKDTIDVEYSTNYIGNKNLTHIIKDPSGCFFVHYLVKLDRLSVNVYQDTYYANLRLNGTIKSSSDKLIYQFEKTYHVKLDQEKFNHIKNSSFAISDAFPIIPGQYTLSLLLKNTTSKEFTSFEKDIHVPQDEEKIYMTSPLLAYGINPNTSFSVLAPFQIQEGQLLCSIDRTFLKSDNLHVFFQVFGIRENMMEEGKICLDLHRQEEKLFHSEKKISEFSDKNNNFLLTISLEDFPAGYYSITVSILNHTGQPILKESSLLSIANLNQIPRPQIVSKVISSYKESIIPYILGTQYYNKGDLIKSRPLMEEAYNSNPNFIDFALGLSRVYQLMGSYKKIESILLPFKEESNVKAEVLFHLARANEKQGQLNKAAGYYRDYIKNFGMNLEILNSLGFCYYKLGNNDEAQKAWKKSLEINPEQPKIKKLLDTITHL